MLSVKVLVDDLNLMPQQKSSKVIVGDASAELRGIQILAVALSNAAAWIANNVAELSHKPIPPLLHGAAKAISLASVSGLETPVEIWALAARNTFELYIRLKHILLSDENSQAWREEAVTDQLQIYYGILKQDPPEPQKGIFQAELERVKRHAAERGLRDTTKLLRIRDLARETHLEGEYDAFYKVYSKFVHPSSFLINWPVAASTPMYRYAFVVNVQTYGHLILEELRQSHGLPTAELIVEAEKKLDSVLLNQPSSQ
jgi:hypothetical protein